MAQHKPSGQKAGEGRGKKDPPTLLVNEGRNEGRKPDGGDDQGDGHLPRHNDDKGEGRGVAGGGKNQDRRKK
jgi:hypothetical protein